MVQATAANLNATVVASGNFNNASVSATAAAPPGSATYIGGSVTTASPTYTTGQMDPLSLTTAGALRIDGSAVTQPVSGTVTANAGTGNFTVVQATATNLNATVVQGICRQFENANCFRSSYCCNHSNCGWFGWRRGDYCCPNLYYRANGSIVINDNRTTSCGWIWGDPTRVRYRHS